jgi:DNA replication and repair protein RecF
MGTGVILGSRLTRENDHPAEGGSPDRGLLPDAPDRPRLWLRRIALTGFRSYAAATVEVGPEPVVLLGPNGAGKTNLLEAISLLAPGSGLRRASFAELARIGGAGDWAVAARVATRDGVRDIGTGQRPDARGGRLSEGETTRAGRVVRIDGQTVGAAALADHVEMVWLTPAMDGLFTGPAAERRAFLDRLVLCFDAGHAPRSARFERAMRQRNRLLEDGGASVPANRVLLDALEMQMAEAGMAIAAARLEAVAALAAHSESRRAREAASPFPWFTLALDGTLEAELGEYAAIDAEDRYRARLREARDRDGGAGRTLEGPHRSDLVVGHGPKAMPARLSSTGEQKALLMGLVLAHAGLIAERRDGAPPILLLDEIAAHFDAARRAALFDEILALGAQAWMTGTDETAFAALAGRATIARVEDGRITIEAPG